MGVLGVGEGQCVAGIEKGQWRRWSGSTGALVRVNGVNGGIEQWGLNGGIGQGQWGY